MKAVNHSMSNHQGMRRQAGFSLIEIMVVVIIIGLLASIVAPAVLDRAFHVAGVRAVGGRIRGAKPDDLVIAAAA